MARIKDIDGLPVIDAKRPIILTVTSADIRGANVKEPDQCAFARACRRALHVKEARIHLTRMYLRTNDTNWVRYLVPTSARAEIIAFDRGGRFEPGEFRFVPATPSDRLGKSNKRSPRKTVGKKARPYHVLTNVRAGPA